MGSEMCIRDSLGSERFGAFRKLERRPRLRRRDASRYQLRLVPIAMTFAGGEA